MKGASGLAVLLLSTIAFGQDAQDAGAHQKANESFFGWWIVLILLAGIALMVALEVSRSRRRRSGLPEFTDATFESEVLESRMPVLVHFALEWNVANAAARSQTELLAWQNRGAVRVGTLEVDKNPMVMERLPGLEPPAYLLFYQGRKLFHRPGLRQADEIQDDIDRALAKEGF